VLFVVACNPGLAAATRHVAMLRQLRRAFAVFLVQAAEVADFFSEKFRHSINFLLGGGGGRFLFAMRALRAVVPPGRA
jgi:hypothetical protein